MIVQYWRSFEDLARFARGATIRPDRLALRLPIVTIVLVAWRFPDDVDADHWVTGLAIAAHHRVDVIELAVAVRVLLALRGLGIGLQAATRLMEQRRNGAIRDRMALSAQCRREQTSRLARPTRRRLRVTTSLRIHQRIQRRSQPAIVDHRSLATRHQLAATDRRATPGGSSSSATALV